MNHEILELAFLFGLAGVFGLVARVFKQPLILAFLAVGVVIGIFQLSPIATNPLYQTFSDLGIMFLLFLIGMEINISSLRLVGAASVVIGLGQIAFTFVGGFILGLLLGFGSLAAAYIAIALTFSSTIIIVKLLSEKRDMHSLYGKISVGLLLVQDFVAILILLILAGVHAGQGINWSTAIAILLRGIVLFGLMAWLGRSVMPKIFNQVARSTELLFVSSIAWVFIIAAIVQRLGFSIEIGGFLAGLALANSAEHFQISNRIKPLRDFFLLLFFVSLGSTLALSDLQGIGWPAVVFSLFVLIGNPLIVLMIMGAMGYHRRTSFLAGVTVAQISEFSLVLAALGYKVGHIGKAEVTLITLVGVITIALSSYMILYGEKIYLWLEHWLRYFERDSPKPDRRFTTTVNRPIILIGAHRTGQNIIKELPKKQVGVIDFDPDIVTKLSRQGYAAVYGDITDPDLEEAVGLRQARYIISTSPDVENNLHFLQSIVRGWPKTKRPQILMRAETVAEANLLYGSGSDYVFIPTLASGQHLGRLLAAKPRTTAIAKFRNQERRAWATHALQ